MADRKGQGRATVQLRGNGRGRRLAKRIEMWKNNKLMQQFPQAFHKPGSFKK